MNESSPSRKVPRSFGYTWKLPDGSLCHFASPFASALKCKGPPALGAKLIRVELVEVDHRDRPK